MTVKTEFSFHDISDDVLNKLRAELRSNDPRSRGTETTANLTGDGSTTSFLVNNNLSYIASVTVNGNPITYGIDYKIDYRINPGHIIFTIAPSNGAAIVVTYGHVTSSSNFVFPDLPKDSLTEDSQPRVGFLISHTSGFAGSSGGAGYAISHDILLQVKVVGRTSKECTDIAQLVFDYITTNAKNFTYFRFIEPSGLNDVDNFADNTKDSFVKLMSFSANQKYQLVTYA